MYKKKTVENSDMPDYQKGLIYKLESSSEDGTPKTFYGATTTTLKKKLAEHRCRHKKGLDPRTAGRVLKYPNVAIVLVEHYPSKTKEHLDSKLYDYIKGDSSCTNRLSLEDYEEIAQEKLRPRVQNNLLDL